MIELKEEKNSKKGFYQFNLKLFKQFKNNYICNIMNMSSYSLDTCFVRETRWD